MDDQERKLWAFADIMDRGIATTFREADLPGSWVDGREEAEELMSRMRGIFVASLVGEVEERLSRDFGSTFQQLSDRPSDQRKYRHEDIPRRSTLRGRAKIMWAVRLTYTHGNGLVSQIEDDDLVELIQDAQYVRRHFRGIHIRLDRLWLGGDVTYPAIKTQLEILDRLAPAPPSK